MTEQPMQTKRIHPLLLGAALFLVLLVGGLIGWRAWDGLRQTQSAAEQAAEQEAAMAAIEDKWGIRVTRVVPTADGGLVDLRYQITDPDKAIYLFDSIENIPSILVEENGREISLNTLPHRHDLEFGQTYFMIFRNEANSVKPGGLVTVNIGDLRVEHYQVLQ